MLILFSKGNRVSRGYLERRFPMDMIDEAVARGYIYQCGPVGVSGRESDIQYCITSTGKAVRDGH